MPRKAAPRRKRSNGTGSIRVIKGGHELRYPAHLGGGTRKIMGGTYAHAEVELNKYIAGRDVRFVEMGPVPTLSEWAQKYLDSYSKNQHRPATRDNYEHFVRHKIDGNPIGRVPITALTEGDIEDWFASLGTKAETTLRTYRDYLQTIMQFAVQRRRDVQVNPVRTAIMPSSENCAPAREIMFLDDHEIRRFLEQCQTEYDAWGPLWIVSALLGLRPGEACALHWSDVHFDATVPYVKVQFSLIRPISAGGEAVGIGPTKHVSHKRDVEMPQLVIDALRHQQRRRVTPADERWHDMVFLRDDGTPLSLRYANQQIKATSRAAWTALLTPYSLRHSCASWLIDAGVAPQKIAWMMGTSIAMLQKHYGHKMGGDIHTIGTKVMNGLATDGKVVPLRKRRAG